MLEDKLVSFFSRCVFNYLIGFYKKWMVLDLIYCFYIVYKILIKLFLDFVVLECDYLLEKDGDNFIFFNVDFFNLLVLCLIMF